MHDRGDNEKEKGGKKLVGTREGGGGRQKEEKNAVFVLTSEAV